MRIVISINTSWNIYNFRRGLIMFLKENGHEVIALAPKDDYSRKLESELGMKYYPVEMDNKGSNPINDYKLYQAYQKLFSQIKPDVILQFTIKPNIYGTLAAKKLKIPVINNVSGLGTIFINPNTITAKVGFYLYRKAFKHAYKVIFQNQDDRQLFIDMALVKPEISELVPGSGVDLDRFKKTSMPTSDKMVFLMISRLLYDKGVMEYAESAKRIKEKFEKVEFQLLGFHDESKGSIPKELLDDWQESGVINYLGETSDVLPYIQKANCIVLPSYREGTPKTLLEALAVGRPIITTNTAGCKETVIDDQNGYLCEVKNVDSLVEAMSKYLELDSNHYQQMGEESRRIAESKFDQQIVFKKYKELIDGVH